MVEAVAKRHVSSRRSPTSWPTSSAGWSAALATASSPSTCSARAPAATTSPTATSTSRWCSIRRSTVVRGDQGDSGRHLRSRCWRPATTSSRGRSRRAASRTLRRTRNPRITRADSAARASRIRWPDKLLAKAALRLRGRRARCCPRATSNGAVNRAYYAMFYAAQAATGASRYRGHAARKHGTLVRQIRPRISSVARRPAAARLVRPRTRCSELRHKGRLTRSGPGVPSTRWQARASS